MDWDENADNIAQARADLGDAIKRAADAIGAALGHLADLRSPRIYDVEYAEGHAGDDVKAYLTGTGRALRAAAAMVAQVTAAAPISPAPAAPEAPPRTLSQRHGPEADSRGLADEIEAARRDRWRRLGDEDNDHARLVLNQAALESLADGSPDNA